MRSQVETEEERKDREAKAERQRRFGLFIESETEEISKIMAAGGKFFKAAKMRMQEIEDAKHIYTRDKKTGKIQKSEMRSRRIVIVPEHLSSNLLSSIDRINAAANYYDELVRDEYPNKMAKRPEISLDPIAKEIRFLFYKAHSGSTTNIDQIKSEIIDTENSLVRLYNSQLQKGQEARAFDPTCRNDLKLISEYEDRHPGVTDIYSRRESGHGLRIRVVDSKNKTRHFSIASTIFILSKSDASVREAESRISPDSRLPEDRIYLSSIRVTLYEKKKKPKIEIE